MKLPHKHGNALDPPIQVTPNSRSAGNLMMSNVGLEITGVLLLLCGIGLCLINLKVRLCNGGYLDRSNSAGVVEAGLAFEAVWVHVIAPSATLACLLSNWSVPKISWPAFVVLTGNSPFFCARARY